LEYLEEFDNEMEMGNHIHPQLIDSGNGEKAFINE
jgi:hypothetical protein